MKLFVGAKAVVHFRGKVLLVRESTKYEDGTKPSKWDVVGGRIQAEEEVRAGLVREVAEESGLTVAAGESLGVFDGWPEIRGEKCHVVRLYFWCEADSDEVTLSSDHDEYEWVDPGNYVDKELMDDIAEMLELAGKRIIAHATLSIGN